MNKYKISEQKFPKWTGNFYLGKNRCTIWLFTKRCCYPKKTSWLSL